jgi:hypothetical protein
MEKAIKPDVIIYIEEYSWYIQLWKHNLFKIKIAQLPHDLNCLCENKLFHSLTSIFLLERKGVPAAWLQKRIRISSQRVQKYQWAEELVESHHGPRAFAERLWGRQVVISASLPPRSIFSLSFTRAHTKRQRANGAPRKQAGGTRRTQAAPASLALCAK